MKILFYSQEFYPYEVPATKRVYGLAQHLIKLGHEVDVVCGFYGWKNFFKFFAKKVYQGINVYYYYAFPLYKKINLLRVLHHFSFLFSSQLHNFRFRRKYDVVITTTPPALVSFGGLWIAKFKRAKLIYDVRDIWPDVALEMNNMTKGSIMYKVFNYIANKMYQKADLVTAVSRLKVEKLQAKGIPKVKLISNGFDLEFKNQEIDHEIIDKYQLDQTFTIIYTGNIGLAQGLDSLIALAEIVKNNELIQFLLIGEGVEKTRLERLATDKGLTNVKFLGKLPGAAIYTFLKSAKLSYVALKNSNLQDSVPTKLFEALGVGCPVLLVASGEACRILDEATLGEHVKPEDFEALVATFYKIYNNYEVYQSRSSHSENYIEKHFSRKMIAKTLEKELIKL